MAFTKYQDEVYDATEYRIVGPDGMCEIGDYANSGCNFGQNSAPVIMVDPVSTVDAVQDQIRLAFLTASDNPDFMSLVTKDGDGGVFSGSTQSFAEVSSSTTEEHMGQAYTNYEGLRKATYPARWCPVVKEFEGETEEARCNDVVNALREKEEALDGNYLYEWSCISPEADKDSCIQAIQEGRAEFVTLGVGDERLEDGGHQIFDAFYDNDMRAVVEEDYGEWHGDSYYAVALVKKSSGITNINDLKGKKLCSTGYGNTAGWDMPLGAMLQAGIIEEFVGSGGFPNDLLTVRNHFGATCAPRQTDNPQEELCDLCSEHCAPARLDLDLYQGFKGAFRCLMDPGGPLGDVAFVEGQTVYKFAEGQAEAKSWADGTGGLEDYRLLCLDGTYVDVNRTPDRLTFLDNYFECNLGRLPSAAVATGSQLTHAQFVAAQETFLSFDRDRELRAAYLENSNGLVFSTDTKFLLPIPAGTQVYLGEVHDQFQAVEDLNNKPPTGGGDGGGNGGGSDSGEDGISSGEAAALAFAMMGVGVGGTFLAGYGIRQYRIKQQGMDLQKTDTFSGSLMNDGRGT